MGCVLKNEDESFRFAHYGEFGPTAIVVGLGIYVIFKNLKVIIKIKY